MTDMQSTSAVEGWQTTQSVASNHVSQKPVVDDNPIPGQHSVQVRITSSRTRHGVS